MRIFHICIIAYSLFFLSGCGYKADPFYGDETTSSSKNSDKDSMNAL